MTESTALFFFPAPQDLNIFQYRSANSERKHNSVDLITEITLFPTMSTIRGEINLRRDWHMQRHNL
jgi:hypothetical protein